MVFSDPRVWIAVHEVIVRQPGREMDQSTAKSGDAAGFIVEIETLRAIAIVLTLCAHVFFFTTKPDPAYVWIITKVGQFWVGVDLFFVVSGFVVARQLWPLVDRALTSGRLKPALTYFYTRRAFRILPLATFWALVLLVCGLGFNRSGAFGDPNGAVRHFLASIAFVENIYLTFDPRGPFAVYWSLSIEEQFYIALPLLLIVTPAAWRVRVLAALVLAQLFLPRPVDQSNLLSMVRYDALLMGVLLYRYSLQPHFLKFRGALLRHIWAGRAVAVLLVLFIVLTPVWLARVWFMTGLVDLGCALIVLIAIGQAGVFRPSHRFLAQLSHWLGSRSFGLYLAHLPVAAMLQELHVRTGVPFMPERIADLRLLIVLAAIAVATEVVFRRIEQPLRTHGRRISSQKFALASAGV